MQLVTRNSGGSPQAPNEHVYHGEFLGAEGSGHRVRGGSSVAYQRVVEHYLTSTTSRTPPLIDEYA